MRTPVGKDPNHQRWFKWTSVRSMAARSVQKSTSALLLSQRVAVEEKSRGKRAASPHIGGSAVTTTLGHKVSIGNLAAESPAGPILRPGVGSPGEHDSNASMTKRPRRSSRRRPDLRFAQESRAADVLTVGWMLCVVSLVVIELVCVTAHLYVRVVPEAKRMAFLAGLLLFASLLLGITALALTPVVLRLRKTPPPQGVLVFAAIVSLAPIAAAAARLIGR